jgi:CheY-like chemotaxis protein
LLECKWSFAVRILILEDDPFIALDLQAIVEGQGHEVVGVFDALGAAQKQLDEGFDFALLDIDVADGKSFGFAAVLIDRQIPFAFVSASQPDELPDHLQEASFIPKPFEEAAILRSISGGHTSFAGRS